MTQRYSLVALFACGGIAADAQCIASIDLLSPGDEGFDGLPSHIRCVDVYFEVAMHDYWIGTGIRVLAESGGALLYADGDANAPGVQPNLINPGYANRFMTSISKPRDRNAAARFENAGVAIVGRYDPTGQLPTTTPGELNVVYFASPPETSGSPSVNGYIARIAADVSATGLPLDYGGWGASRLDAIPNGATIVLRSVPEGAVYGVSVSCLDGNLSGLSWALWWIPEPNTGVCVLLGAILMRCSVRARHREPAICSESL